MMGREHERWDEIKWAVEQDDGLRSSAWQFVVILILLLAAHVLVAHALAANVTAIRLCNWFFT